MKLRVIEDVIGRFVIQRKGFSEDSWWVDGSLPHYFKAEEDALYEMRRRLDNWRREVREGQMKRVIAEESA